MIMNSTDNLDETNYGIDEGKFNNDIDEKQEKFVCIKMVLKTEKNVVNKKMLTIIYEKETNVIMI